MSLKNEHFFLTQLILFLEICSQNADAILIVKPPNVEVLVNQSTYFNCSTSNTTFEITWYHYHVGSYERHDVYDAGAIRSTYKGRFDIEKNISTGAFNLIVKRPTLDDAGKYECQDIRGIGDKASAELIILARDPIYWSTTQATEFIGPNSCGKEPDKLQLSCSVAYYGNIPPHMEWKKNNYSILEGVTQRISANNVTYNLSIEADLPMDNSFVCETSRFAHNQYSCHSPVFKVHYAVRNYTNVTISTGDKVVCFVNSSHPCNYRWKWFQDEDVTVESSLAVLRPKKTGWHKCTAECSLRGRPCTIEEAMSAFVFEGQSSRGWVISVIIFVILATLVIILVVVVNRRRLRLTQRKSTVKVFDISQRKQKKEKSTDCDSALIPLLCVHG